jgi:hypothetical protein
MIRIHCDNCEKGFNFGNVPHNMRKEQYQNLIKE